MPLSAKVLTDSISPAGHRLTTLEVTLPRMVLAEFNTHRVFSRNSASSRAIPVDKLLKMVQEDPYIPIHWGKNQKGMQAEQELTDHEKKKAHEAWLYARDEAVESALQLLQIGLHKQITNRLLEPFLWHTVIVSATEWDNFDHLRDNTKASPEMKATASLMGMKRRASTPVPLKEGEWHLPLILPDELLTSDMPDDDLTEEELVRISCARCGRVSYLTHAGVRDPQEDLDLYGRLLEPGHMSPFEHAARPMTKDELEMFRQMRYVWNNEGKGWVPTGEFTYFLGNFDGWVQHRKMIPGEEDILAFREAGQAHG